VAEWPSEHVIFVKQVVIPQFPGYSRILALAVKYTVCFHTREISESRIKSLEAISI
jgi:hypothetical protein